MSGSVSRSLVKLAALTLPAAKRKRYREQWLADVRDAGEAGVSRAQIVFGAIVLAATASRPWPELPVYEPAIVARRSVIALGVAFAAALLGLSQYASILTDADFFGATISGFPETDPVLSAGPTSLLITSAIATAFALTVAIFTRSVPRKIRVAVVLLALAVCAPFAQAAMDNQFYNLYYGVYLRPSALCYLVGAALVAAAAVTVRSTRPHVPGMGGHRLAIVGGLVVAAVAASGTVLGAVMWSHRIPVSWEPDSGAGPATTSNPLYVQWVETWDAGYRQVDAIFAWWAMSGVILGIGVVAVAIIWKASARTTTLLTLGTVFAVVTAEGSLLAFLEVAESGTVPLVLILVLETIGRLGLVTVVIVATALRLRAITSPGASSRARRVSRRAALQ